MPTARVELLVEEPSIEPVLNSLLPRMIPGTDFGIYVHNCKEDLRRKLGNRLRGYASWLPVDWRVLVVLDRDNDDCRRLKKWLEEEARKAGLRTRTASYGGAYQLVNRIIVEEIESWFFGEWEAVRAAYPRVPARCPCKDVENVRGGTWEALERVLQRAGYFHGGLHKTELARAVAPHLTPDGNRSHSFCVLRDVLREMARS